MSIFKYVAIHNDFCRYFFQDRTNSQFAKESANKIDGFLYVISKCIAIHQMYSYDIHISMILYYSNNNMQQMCNIHILQILYTFYLSL